MPTSSARILLAETLLLLLPSAPAIADDPIARLELVWADEFDTDGPVDPAKWTHENGFQRNDEAQWYQPANAVCADGVLRIVARRESIANPNHDARSKNWKRNRHEAEYTSSSINTAGKFSWRYGVMEVRARIDARPGLWPAIWTLGAEGRWPAKGEVDLMEYYDDGLLANACWRPANGESIEWDSTHYPLSRFDDPDWAEAFHTWRMAWDADRIVLSVDDQVLNEIELAEVPTPADGVHPFRQPHYLLLNLAVGGTKGGDPNGTEFPATFEVDYVRVYEPADSAGE